jgi:hypothetical protein
MLKTALSTAENVAVIAAVGLLVHYLAGLDWPWAILIGAAASIVLRRLIQRGTFTRYRRSMRVGRQR